MTNATEARERVREMLCAELGEQFPTARPSQCVLAADAILALPDLAALLDQGAAQVEAAYREGYRDSRLHGGSGQAEDRNWLDSRAASSLTAAPTPPTPLTAAPSPIERNAAVEGVADELSTYLRQPIRDVIFAFQCTHWDAGAKHDLSEEIVAALATLRQQEPRS